MMSPVFRLVQFQGAHGPPFCHGIQGGGWGPGAFLMGRTKFFVYLRQRIELAAAPVMTLEQHRNRTSKSADHHERF